MSLVNAGHPPVLYVPVKGPAEFITARGTPVGILSDAYFETCDMKVSQGDRFYIYSDGLLERVGSRQVWTALTHELPPLVEELRDIPVQQAAKQLNERVRAHKSEPDDDIVIMSIEV